MFGQLRPKIKRKEANFRPFPFLLPPSLRISSLSAIRSACCVKKRDLLFFAFCWQCLTSFLTKKIPLWELHRLVFTHPRPCNEFELKKLSPAVDFSRTLVGVTLNQEGDWEIWGLVHSGTRWLQHHHGGRKIPPEFPNTPVIWVRGPGRLTVLRGTESLATLTEGRILTPAINVFESNWLRDYFDWTQLEWPEIYLSLLEKQNWPAITDPNLPGIIVRQAIMRIISTMPRGPQRRHYHYCPP